MYKYISTYSSLVSFFFNISFIVIHYCVMFYFLTPILSEKNNEYIIFILLIGETRDVRRARGQRYRFTFGDYICKTMIGAVDPAVHMIDLPQNPDCCLIL